MGDRREFEGCRGCGLWRMLCGGGGARALCVVFGGGLYEVEEWVYM